MTVPVPGSLTYSYDEDGITTVFAYPVRFFEPQELEVVREVGGVRTTLTYNVDYTVSGAGSPSGGSITRAAATDGGKIIITRNTAWKQIVDLTNNGRNPAESVEQQLDRLTMAGQDSYERFSPLADKVDDLDNAVALANAAANAAEDAQAAAEGAAAAVTPELQELRDEAVEAAGVAENEDDRARDEADRAQSASDSAFVNADVYPDTAAGLAGTSEGDQFQVVDDDEIVRYRHDSGPVATEVARYPSATEVLAARRGLPRLINSIEDAQRGLYARSTDDHDLIIVVYADGSYRDITHGDETTGGVVSGVPFSAVVCGEGITNQWVWPTGIEIPSRGGEIFMAPITNGYRARDGIAKRLGTVRAMRGRGLSEWSGRDVITIWAVSGEDTASDDHNSASPIARLSAGADLPLVIMQNDHGATRSKIVRVPSWDIADAEPFELVNGFTGGASYSMSARKPDDPDTIFHHFRTGSSQAARWRVGYTHDDTETWSETALYGDGTGSEYMLGKTSWDKTGWHHLIHEHPMSGVDQRIVYLKLGWDGSLSDPVNGEHVSDVFAADVDWAAFAAGQSMTVRTPAAGWRTRLFDFLETEENKIEVVLAEFTLTGIAAGEREYRHVRFDASTGVIESDSSLGDSGWPLEIPSGTNYYFAGLTVVGPYHVVATRWITNTVITHGDHVGHSEMVDLKSTDQGATWTETLLMRDENRKIFRPLLLPRLVLDGDNHEVLRPGNFVQFCAGRYTTYLDFESDVYLTRRHF